MPRAIALRSDFSATELRCLARRSMDAAQARRLLALAVIYDGGTRSEAARQLPQARLTMLDRATDRLCRGGAPVENLAHRASFHACEKTAPSNPRIKHLTLNDRATVSPRNRRQPTVGANGQTR